MEFISKLSRKEKIGLGIAAAILLIALLDRAVVKPVRNRVRQINREIKVSEMELGHALRNISRQDAISEKYKKCVQYVTKPGTDEERVAEALTVIEELARKSGVYLADIKPQTTKTIDFYKEYSAEIEIEGGMESIMNFLHQLSNSSQLLRIEKIRLNMKAKESRLIKAAILVTKIVVP